MKKNNFFIGSRAAQDELFETIVMNSSVKIERIVSNGQATPDGHWYDQDRDEWVLLLKGSAGVLLEGAKETVSLLPGDYMLLPAHCRHRVVWTEKDAQTIWLAVHM